ncbi:hypothetical protein DXG01_011742, partial [Tephrocybe rancida]
QHQIPYNKSHQHIQIVQLARATRDTARLEKELASQQVKEAQVLLDLLCEEESHSNIRLAEASAQVKEATHCFTNSKIALNLKGPNKDDISARSDGDAEEDADMDEFLYSLATEPAAFHYESSTHPFMASAEHGEHRSSQPRVPNAPAARLRDLSDLLSQPGQSAQHAPAPVPTQGERGQALASQ